MKSLNETTKTAIATIGTEAGKSVALTLPPREVPLDEKAVEKIEEVLKSSGACKVETKYGNVPVRDDEGEIIKWVFGAVETKKVYDPEKISEKIRDTLLRPASKQAIAFHLIRLGAHVRDTMGAEALAVKASDIAREIDGVSEWAVIETCREVWLSKQKWYPQSGELVETIRRKDEAMKAMLNPPEKKTMLAAPIKAEKVAPLDDIKPWSSFKGMADMPDDVRMALWDFCVLFHKEGIAKIYCNCFAVDYADLKTWVEGMVKAQ